MCVEGQGEAAGARVKVKCQVGRITLKNIMEKLMDKKKTFKNTKKNIHYLH